MKKGHSNDELLFFLRSDITQQTADNSEGTLPSGVKTLFVKRRYAILVAINIVLEGGAVIFGRFMFRMTVPLL